MFTSNVFAIMGLRALYFLLAGVMDLFRYLSYGLSAILIFIGIKMLLHHWWKPEPLAVAAGDRVAVGDFDHGVADRGPAGAEWSWNGRRLRGLPERGDRPDSAAGREGMLAE